jgi:hypothetical protein
MAFPFVECFEILWIHIVKKVKQSCNRPGVAQSVPGGLNSQISWHSAREGGEVVSLTHRPPLPPGMFLVLIFTRGWVDPRAMVWLEGDMSLKNPVTPLGIDPGTVRLVAQCLNHYATPGSIQTLYWTEYYWKKVIVNYQNPDRNRCGITGYNNVNGNKQG